MTNLAINTSQNVNIDFATASVGERILAFIIDFAILFAYYIVMAMFVSMIDFADYWSQAGFIGTLMLPMMFYTLILENFLGGQTLGKKVVKIKVVKIDGFEAGFQDYFVRWVLRLIDIFASTGAVAIVSTVMSSKTQRLGDMAAGTAVISLKTKTNINQTILMRLEDAYEARFVEAQFLSDNDARIIKKNFEIAYKDANYELMKQLSMKITDVLKIEKGNMSDIEFITTILKDFNFYTGNQN